MAFHCGAPTRDGSPCQRHVRGPGTRCPQHRNLGGTALHPPRIAMRIIPLDPALAAAPSAWPARDRVTPDAGEESRDRAAGTLEGEGMVAVDAESGREPGRDGDAAADAAGESAANAAGGKSAARPGDDADEAAAEADGTEADGTEPEPDPQPVEQRPLLRKERPLDPDWIGARPLFRDETPAQPVARIEFEPSNGAPRKPPRIAPMRSVVLNPPEDPPTLVDRIPPIDPEDLAVPDFLRPDFEPAARPAPMTKPVLKRRPTPPPMPQPAPTPDPDPPTLIDLSPVVPSGPDPAAPDLTVPDFVVPGFTVPAPKPPLRTVLSTVLGPELWERCYTEWSPAHCTALARIARGVDGLAPSAGTAVRATAGAGMRWLGVAREREALAEQVAGAISHPAGATAANQARTVRLYGAAICVALNVPLRRCACHRDLERDVSGELIRLGLEELAGEVI